MEACEKEKVKKRQDRSDKLKANKELDQTVVKCSLKGLLEKKQNVKDLIDAIEKRVKECSHRTQLASVALNMFVRDKVDGVPDIELNNVSFPDFWDQTFIRQLLLGTHHCSKPIQDIQLLYSKYPHLLSTLSRSKGDCQIYTFAATKLGVNIRNHLIMNFPKVINRYIKYASGLDNSKDEHIIALYKSHGWSMTKIKKEIVLKPESKEKIDNVVSLIRSVLDIDEGKYITEAWMKGHLSNILKFFIFANRQFEEQGMKLINILPICKTRTHFITLDNTGMLGLLKDIHFVNSEAKDMTMDLWNSVINTDKVKGRLCTFTGTIDTDGVVVNVHFKRKKRYIKEKQEETKEEKIAREKAEFNKTILNKRILACDPGRSNILYIVEKRQDNTFKRYKLTRCQYYKESGINDANKKTNQWLQPIQSYLDILSSKSPKSVNLHTFQDYVNTMLQVADTLWNEYMKKRWREQNLRLYGGKKRVFANFINKLKPDENTVLAYGSAKFAPGSKGEISVPVSQAFKECSYRMKTILVDEYRTTMVHWKDDTILKKVGKMVTKEGKQVTKQIRGLLWCGLDPVTTINQGKFVNRDLNAAINIYRCAVSFERPDSMNRSSQKESLSKVQTKIIL